MTSLGTYPETPDAEDTAVFTADYGKTISTSDTAIQKARAKYTLDTDKASSFTLTESGTTLKIYYKVGNYKITYSYTLPGEDSAITVEKEFYYGQSITEADKPSVTGYTFVGWVYAGSGAAPETMPAENLTATGTFTPMATTYKVVCHLETLGSGENKTGKYEIADSYTQTLNSKQGTAITVYLSKDSDTTENEVEAEEIDGFTLAGVVVSNGDASGNDTLPDTIITSGITTGTVQYDSTKTLYIHYYYTRNVYDLKLEVWRDSRETEGNKIYTSTLRKQYEESVSENTANYKLDSYYDSLAGFTMPTGYKFTSYTDYSTGNEPEIMPAGDVTVTRDVVSNVNVDYTVEIYFEKTEIGKYDLVSTLTYSAPDGSRIHVVDTDTEDTSTDRYLNYTDYVKAVNNSDYYQYIETTDTVSSGDLSSTGDKLVIKTYFERIYTDATITYRYGNEKNNWSQATLATFKVRGKWGSTYTFDPDALFYENTSSNWLESSCYKDALKQGTTITYGSTIAGTSDGTALSTNFKESYLVSYTCYYKYFDANENIAWTWPSETITTIGDTTTKPASVLTASGSGFSPSNKSDIGLKNLATCYFSPTNESYCNISYNQVKEYDYYYLNMQINTNNDAFANRYASADKSVSYNDTQTVTFNYNGDNYPVRVINACAVLNGTRTNAADGLEEYPASSSTTRKYTYSSLTDTKTGFTHITTDWGDDYYYYDGTNEAISIPSGVYIINTSDSFISGAYVSYAHNSVVKAASSNGVLTFSSTNAKSNELTQVDDLLDEYVELHSDSTITDLYDSTVTALYRYNTSWGSAYITSTSSTLTYTYEHRGTHRLQFSFNGKICSSDEHKYAYGYTVPQSAVNCAHITTGIPEGYEVVWYMDGAHTTPIPTTGILMNQDRTIYGRLEKSTITNHEYIYYELADPIDGTINYITKDNLASVSASHTIGSSAKQEKVTVALSDSISTEKYATTTTYYYDDVVVMIDRERPTCTYTELHLSNDTSTYTEFYGKTYDEAYGKTGFYYDDTNTSNRSYGYVNVTALNLQVYFARDKYQVTVNNNNSEIANAEYKQFSIDQHVVLSNPSKDGYTFNEWKWTKAADNTAYTPTYEEGETYFKMPAFNLIANATWTPAAFPQTIMHYFQTSQKSYDTSILSDLAGMTEDVSYNDVSFGDLSGTAQLYKQDDNISGATFTLTDGTVYYFTGAKVNSGTVILDEADLVAAKTQASMTSEAELSADTGKITGLSLYTYSYTSYTAGSTVAKYDSTGKYTVVYGMTLEYYYPRSADLKIRLIGVATDKGDTGLTLTGEGNVSYGDEVNLMAALSSGYTFKGWFAPGDIFTDYSYDSTKGLSEYTVKDNLEADISNNEITAESTDLTYPVNVTENLDLVAVVVPSAVVAPDLTISGKFNYTYGYAQSGDNMLLAVASITGADDDSKQTSVTGYKWYQKAAHLDDSGEAVADDNAAWTELSETSTAYSFTTGKNAGGYLYKCVVSYKRMDNGRTGSVEKEQGVIVDKANMTVAITEYSGIYDNKEHSISVKVESPSSSTSYDIYYNKDTSISSNNYQTAGVTTVPKYTHVNHDEATKTACANVTYIYIKDKTGNYNDYIGSGKVDIAPKSVGIEARSSVFSKMYDGNTSILGSTTESGSDMYNLAHGRRTYYQFTGLISGDTLAESYIIACTATYNDAHVDTARSFTVTGLTVVNPTTGTTEYDYTFPASTSLTFSGNITARPLDIEWQDKSEFVYNGLEQAPTISLSATQTYEIPSCDKDYIEFTVAGKQTNVGSYTATAQAGVKAGGTFNSSDYTFSQLTKTYSIVKRKITVIPDDTIYTYDGTKKTVTTYKIYNTDTNLLDAVVNDTTKYKTSATSVKSYVNAGTYEDMQFKDLVVKTVSGVILNDNYDITYNTGKLTINKASVTVTGITADEKEFDGTTKATIHVGEGTSTLTFSPLYSQNDVADVLSLDSTKVSGVYESSVAGTTTVNLTIGSDALTGRSASNYTLDVSGSQPTATGRIKQNSIKVKANAVTVVYGETPDYTASYSGIYKADGTAGTYADISAGLSGTVKYLIKKNGKWVEYTAGSVDVGTYEIKADVSGLSHNDYTFAWEEDATNSILTVTKRPVTIKSADTPNVTKAYDGTTSASKENVTKTEDYIFTSVSGNDKSGVLSEDETAFDIDRESFKVSYNDKDTYEATKVTLTDISSNNGNYSIVDTNGNATTKLDIKASITKLQLSVTLSDKSIVYGSAEPSGYSVSSNDVSGNYSIQFTGFLSGESESNISSATITLESTYDTAVADNRKVGKYPVTIKASGFDDTNYDLYSGTTKVDSTGVSLDDKLEVTPATITITMPTDKLTYYKIGCDGNGTIPDCNGWTYSGFVYTEDTKDTVFTSTEISALRGYVTAKNSDTEITVQVDTIAGEYVIKLEGVPTYNVPNGTGNYKIEVVNGKYTILKCKLYLSLTSLNEILTIDDKVYDGTTSVSSNSIHYTSEGRENLINNLSDSNKANDETLLAADVTYLKTGAGATDPIIEYDEDNCSFADKNVGNNKSVTIKYKLSDYLANRYELIESATDNHGATCTSATANIIPAPLEIKADDKSIKYGDNAPTYTYTATGLVNGETIEKTTGTNDFSGSVTYTCTYTNTKGSVSGTGTYTITPSGVTNNNYSISNNDGVLTVSAATLATPAPVWSETAPGTVSWSAIAGIGDVTVAGYVVSLYKDGTLVAGSAKGSVESPYTDVSANYAETIRTSGGGKYTVKVKAIASTVNNASNKNVTNSAEGTSADLYATKVTPEFTASTVGKGAQVTIDEVLGDPIVIEGKRNYVIIAGESKTVTATMANATGYTGAATADAGLTLGTSAYSDTAFNIPVSVASDAKPAAETKVYITLSARPAKLAATFAADKTEETYGFSTAVAPVLTVTPSKDATDNIDTDGYTYEVTWKYYSQTNTKAIKDISGNSISESFPNMENGEYISCDSYFVNCYVKATRKDNGQSTELTQIKTASNSKYVKIKIKRGKFEPTAAMAVNSWKFGESRGTLTFEKTQGITEGFHYVYQDTDTNWPAIPADSDTAAWTALDKPMLTNVGTHYVKVYIEASENFDATATNSVAYTVTQNKLSTPSNLNMRASATAPYGLFTWDAVTGPKENNGTVNASDMEIKVAYKVSFLYKAKGGDAQSTLATVTTTDTKYDFTSYVKEAGIYSIKVQAIVANESAELAQAQKNCADSASAERDAVISIGTTVKSNLTGNSYKKVYDGTPMTLSVDYSVDGGAAISYQWMKDGVDISSATAASYNLTYVEETATYTCKISYTDSESQTVTIYSSAAPAEITPRPVTITSGASTKVYDGTALTNSEIKVSDSTPLPSGDTFVSGNDATRTTGTITNAGTKKNTITNVIIKHDDKVVYQNDVSYNNYIVTLDEGELKVTKRPITFTANTKSWTYDGVSHNDPEYNVTESVIDAGLATGEAVKSVSVSGNVKYVSAGNVDNVISNAKISKGENDTTDNYEITYSKGTLSITKRAITITPKDNSKTYDGTSVSQNDYTVKLTDNSAGDAIVSGDTLTVVTSGSIAEYGTAENTVASYTIKCGDTDVSSSYEVTTAKGTLTITKADQIVTMSVNNKTYDGKAYTDPSVTRPSSDGTVTIKYYTANDGSGEMASAPVNVGTYYAKAFVTGTKNYNNAETSYQEFEITRKTLTITANSNSKTYDGTALTDSGYTNSDDLAEGERITSVTVEGTITYYGTDGKAANVPSNAVIKKGDTETTSNYDVSYNDGTLTINKKELTITADSDTKTYDGTALTKNSYTNTALVTGDRIDSITITGSQTTAGESANTALAAVIKNSANTDITSSYNITYKEGKLTVGKRSITVKALPAEQVYNGHALTNPDVTYNDPAEGDTVTATTSGSITNVGVSDNNVASVTIKNSSDADVTSSYNINKEKGTLKITARSLGTDDTYTSGISVDDISDVTYKGTAWEPTVTVKDNVSGTEVTLVQGTDYTLTWQNNIHATTDTSKAYVVISGKGNYSGTIRKSFVIKKKDLTITSDSDSKTYDGTPLTKHSFTQTGLADTDTITVTYTGTITDVSANDNTFTNVKITNSAASVGDVTNDYNITSAYGRLTVNKKSVTIKADDKTSEYSPSVTTLETLTYNIEGTDSKVTADKVKNDLEIVLSTTAQRNTVGTAPITITYTANNNYTVTVTDGTYTVTKARPVITPHGAIFTYDGKEHTIPDATATGLQASDFIYGANKTETKVGTYTVDISSNETANYLAGSAHATLTIKQRPITITAASVSESPLVATDVSSNEYSITSGTLAEDETITEITVSGNQAGIGSSANRVYGAVIKDKDGVDVTDQYAITYVNGVLRIGYPQQETQPESSGGSTPASEPVTETPAETPAETPVQSPVRRYTRLPVVITVVPPTTEDEPEEVPTEGKGSLQIIVENEYKKEQTSGGGTSTTESGTGTSVVTLTELHVDGSLPNIEEAECVLTDEEKEKLADGSDIIIRLTVDDTRTEDTDDAMSEYIDNLGKELNETATDDEKVTVAFKTYVDLTLEKSVDNEDWQRILDSGDAITVTISIPEGLIKEGETLRLVKRDGSGYITLEDLDDDPTTFTILTSDFESEYAIVSILDSEAALAYGLGLDSGDTDTDVDAAYSVACFWHWFILITDLIYLVGLVLSTKKKDEDDMEEDDFEKLKKKSKRWRYAAQTAFILLMVLWNYLGWCRIELPASIISGVLISLLQWASYKKKFKESDEETEGEVQDKQNMN